MGQAKRRGSFETRLKEGIEKERFRQIVREERAKEAHRKWMEGSSTKTLAAMAMMAGLGIGV